MTKSLTALALIAGAAAFFLTPAAAKAEDLVVQYDQARLLPLEKPAANIIIGNPSIADVTMKSTKLLVITGKSFGVTNLMILDEQDKVIYSSRLMVRADESKVVTLTKAEASYTFACTPTCQKMRPHAPSSRGIAWRVQAWSVSTDACFDSPAHASSANANAMSQKP